MAQQASSCGTAAPQCRPMHRREASGAPADRFTSEPRTALCTRLGSTTNVAPQLPTDGSPDTASSTLPLHHSPGADRRKEKRGAREGFVFLLSPFSCFF